MQITLQDTLELVKSAHAETNSMDKNGNTPYYWHLLRVMLRLKNTSEDSLHIALLHDVIEDTKITLEDLTKFGYNNNVVDSVKWCSRNMFPNLSYSQWMQKIGQEGNTDAIIVKIADLSDNLGFERMHGLMNNKQTNITKKNQKKVSQYPIQLIIDKKNHQGLRLSGEMCMYSRYYKGWNHLFEKSDNLSLISHVQTEDFCNIEQLMELIKWLPLEEKLNYFLLNNIKTWQVKGTLDIINSKNGLPYVALKVKSDIGQLYKNFLADKIDTIFINNQQVRDCNDFHITIINPMQYSHIIKNTNLKPIIDNFIDKSFDLFSYGIGYAEDLSKEKKAWFTILDNYELTNWRKQFSIPNQDFHITLAFEKSDVFGKTKNKNSVVFKNEIIWQNFVQQSLILKKKNINIF